MSVAAWQRGGEDVIIGAVRARAAIAASLLATLLLPAGLAPARARSAQEIRSAAVAWAVKQGGVRERGTSNCSPVIDRWQRDMGLRVPPCRVWCGALVHQAFLRAGVRLSPRIIDPHRSYSDAVAGRRHLRKIERHQVRPGDLLFFRFRPGLKASHLAIVRTRPRNGKVKTVEGNVSHAVRLETRSVRYAVLAARVVP